MTSKYTITEFGGMSSCFDKKMLAEICVEENGIQTGPFGTQLHQKDYVAVGVPIITVEHLGENRIVKDNLPKVSDEDWKRLSKYELRKGDIVFSRVGSVDRRALVRSEEVGWLFSGRCLRVRPNPSKIEPEYLSWFFGLQSFKEYIRKIAVGATMPSLNTKILSDIPIYFPPLPVQRSIASILGALDDKIEVNRRMNETLEATARALYKSWFVDFDPVKAKAEGRKPFGMDEETAALFPDGFEESKMGRIPKGWRVNLIGDVSEINARTLNANDSLNEIRYIEISEVMKGEIGNIVIYQRGSEPSRARRRLKHGDTVLSTVRPDRKAYFLALHPRPDLIASTGFAVISSKEDNWAFLHSALTMPCIFETLGTLADGGAYPAVRSEIINKIEICIPKKGIIEKYENIARPLFEMSWKNREETRNLSNIREQLLPRLLSGELRLKGAEKLVSEAV